MDKLKEECLNKFTIDGSNGKSLACAVSGEKLWEWITNNFIPKANPVQLQVKPNEVVAGGNYRQIKFYCKCCGKEMFDDMELEDPTHLKNTIKDMLFYTDKCSDCSYKKSQREA